MLLSVRRWKACTAISFLRHRRRRQHCRRQGASHRFAVSLGCCWRGLGRDWQCARRSNVRRAGCNPPSVLDSGFVLSLWVCVSGPMIEDFDGGCLLIIELLDGLVSPCWASSFWQSPQKEPKGLAPPSGSRCARLPSFHRCSERRRARAIPGPSSGGRLVLSRHPCRSLPSARIPFGLLKGAIGGAC